MLFQWLVGSEQGACMTKEAVKKWKSIFTASASFGWCRSQYTLAIMRGFMVHNTKMRKKCALY